MTMRHWIRLSLLCRCKWNKKTKSGMEMLQSNIYYYVRIKGHIVSTQETSCVYIGDSCVYTRDCLTVLCFAWQRSFACMTVLCFAWLSFALHGGFRRSPIRYRISVLQYSRQYNMQSKKHIETQNETHNHFLRVSGGLLGPSWTFLDGF